MTNTYFLGANSAKGFFSLYDQFATAPGDRLHVIKGGPGTGKSGFMRRIGEEAETRGYDVEYVLCSGDPDSLDGVYIPALRQAWADGTAPHILDPRVFGVNGDYVNLGGFCRQPLLPSDSQEILRLNRAYKALYTHAYGYLAAAARLRRVSVPQFSDAAPAERAAKRVSGILRRHSSVRPGRGRLQKRFLSAVSCRGKLRLSEEVSKLCKLIYCLDDGLLLAGGALEAAAEEALERGLDVILCPSPLEPSVPEALLLPQDSLALLSGSWDVPDARHIRLDALVPAQLQKAYRAEIRSGRQLADAALEAGLTKLREAKALHDELELIYRPYMDFAALTAFTNAQLDHIFS